jgi:peptidyl-prolyl cis-trans isomerase B (cyclophilin B)
MRLRPPSRRRYLSALIGAVTLVALLAACSSSGGKSASDNPVVSSSASNQTGTLGKPACAYPKTQQPASKDVGTPSTTGLLAPNTLTLDLAVGSAAPKPVVITLKPDSAPCTVNAISYLASKGYFDKTTCHRLTTADAGISVLQCGDPSGTGAGGPGFSYADELSGSETYPTGTVAMANAGPNTNGSQFFLVYGNTPLPPKWTVFGSFATGLDVVTAIGAAGTADGTPDGTPKQTVTITQATTS